MKLQVNTSGAWKDVVRFEPTRKAEVIEAVRVLQKALGEHTKWCVVDETGNREWLR